MRAVSSCLFLLLMVPVVATRADDAVEFRVLDVQQGTPELSAPADLVIRDERQWCEFVAATLSPVPCDEFGIDFGREVVIASAIGARPNGCYSVAIRSITKIRRPRRLQVIVAELFPGRGCTIACTQAIVYPVAAVVVSKPVGRVEFLHQQVSRSCPR